MTLGEERVRVSFNPSHNAEVDGIKRKTAELIDACQRLKAATASNEVMRLASLAQTAYEEAGMWAVKAATHEH